MPERFEKSAAGAIAFLSHLIDNAEYDTNRIASPQLLEMLTLCRETHLSMPLIEVFSKACDEPPAVVLLGGSLADAVDIAHCVGLEADLCEIPDAPVMWWVQKGRAPRTVVQIGAAERELSDAALGALLASPLPPDRVTVLRREISTTSQWRFAWLPDPQALALHAAWPALLEAMVGAQVAIFVGDEIPSAFQPWFARPGIVSNQFAPTEFVRDDIRPQFLAQLQAMQEQTYDEQQSVNAATWQYLQPRIVDQLDSLRQQYAIEIDRQNMKLQVTRQTLGEYRRNWGNGIHNILDEYFGKKVSGNAMAVLIDPRQPGPQPATYMQALSLPNLWKRLHELLTERLGEFVHGLGALAIRVELRSIALKELDMKWNPANLASAIEDELTEKRIFAEGGGERSGLVGSLIGKNDEISSTRKAQITRANKTVQQMIEHDFLQWSDRLMHAVEQRVRVQIAAALVNQGLPDIEALRAGLTGIDRLTSMLEGNLEGTRQEPPKRVANVLRSWGQRRWFRRFVPAA